jgi:predicted DNA binding CopG/RHH family protein
MYKESIIKISKPIPKVQIQQDESELQQQVITQTQETSLFQELQEQQTEQADITEPVNMRFASTDSSGWKVSEILREIRLDSFEMGCVD